MPEAHVKPCYMSGNSLEPSPLLMEKREGLDNQPERTMNDLNWLVGIVEGGENCFSLSIKQRYGKIHRAYFPVIQIANTNIEMMIKLRKILSDINLTYYFYAQMPKTGLPYYRLEVGGIKRIKRFLNLTLPLFRCKYQQANLLLEYANMRLSKSNNAPIGQEEHDIAQKIYKLNGKSKNSSLSSETNTRGSPDNGDEDRVRPFAKAQGMKCSGRKSILERNSGSGF